MKKMYFIGKLISYERLNNSKWGNPKYSGVFEDKDGNMLNATTATNASCAYGFKNYIDKERKLTYHVTPKGSAIIDYIDIL